MFIWFMSIVKQGKQGHIHTAISKPYLTYWPTFQLKELFCSIVVCIRPQGWLLRFSMLTLSKH